MSNYTHCRGCGVKLGGNERIDGLCCRGDGVEGCTVACMLWRWPTTSTTASEAFGPEFWKSPAWSVAIDEWLAATR